MIRPIAVVILCLAGVGVIAAAAMKSASAPSAGIVFPVAAGNKADRLPISKKDIPAEADKAADAQEVVVAYTPPPEQTAVNSPQAAAEEAGHAEEAGRTDSSGAIHQHDQPHHGSGAKAARHRTRRVEHARAHTPDKPDKEAIDVKECPSDGLRPLLRRLNLVSADSC